MEADQIIQKDDFIKKNTTQKLDAMADAINKIYQKMNDMTSQVDDKLKPVNEAIFDKDAGILPQIEGMVQHAKSSDEALESLTAENLQLRDEIDVLKGVVHKLANQLQLTNAKLDLTIARSMNDNLIITGVVGDTP